MNDDTQALDPHWVLGHRPCSWCGTSITVVRRPGRPRLYCNQTCRQRAYEHRHGFLHQRTVLPLPGQAHDDPTGGCGYEQGIAPTHHGRVHAMRTSVRPDGKRRETLCGLLVKPILGRWFSPGAPRSCETCSAVADKHPLTFGVSASNELSRLRSLIQEGVERRHPPAATLRWLATDAGRAA